MKKWDETGGDMQGGSRDTLLFGSEPELLRIFWLVRSSVRAVWFDFFSESQSSTRTSTVARSSSVAEDVGVEVEEEPDVRYAAMPISMLPFQIK